MNRWKDERKDEWKDESIKEWKDERMKGWKNERIKVWKTTYPAAIFITIYPQARGKDTRVKSKVNIKTINQGGSCSTHTNTAWI